LIEAAIVDFLDGGFVELAFVVQDVDDGSFGFPHGEIGVDTVSESFDLGKVLFASEFHFLDVIFGFFEVFDDTVVFFDELVDFNSGLVKLNDSLGLVSDEFGFDLVDILEEGFAFGFKLFDFEFDLIDVLGMPGDEGLLKIAELGVFLGEGVDSGLEFGVEGVEMGDFCVDDGDFIFEEGDLLEVGGHFLLIFMGLGGVMLFFGVEEMLELLLLGEEGISLISERVDGEVELVQELSVIFLFKLEDVIFGIHEMLVEGVFLHL
jgi:hypothetical protein